KHRQPGVGVLTLCSPPPSLDRDTEQRVETRGERLGSRGAVGGGGDPVAARANAFVHSGCPLIERAQHGGSVEVVGQVSGDGGQHLRDALWLILLGGCGTPLSEAILCLIEDLRGPVPVLPVV